MIADRPDPDALLAQVTDEEKKSKHGRLKIFFGASAGVGKTYAMLTAAAQLKKQGIDAVIGTITTHGRKETVALVDGLEVLPAKKVEHHNTILDEFDLDAALARHPEVLLVDELPHTNAPGSRHPKRWQDVEELLNAGIDVFTTINVQHLESLNDIIGGITGIRVRETVPDHIFDSADEVVLVDLAPDDLLTRLKEGKVYIPDQVEHAIQNFFRKGNLIALRELALRRTADRINDQMQSARREKVSGHLSGTRQALLVCVGPRGESYNILRRASRLAAALDGGWRAIFVETPALQKLSERKRRNILRLLKFAQDLGAITATIPAQNIAMAIVDYANKAGLQTVFIGRSNKPSFFSPWRKTLAQQITELAPHIEVVITPEEERQSAPITEDVKEKTPIKWKRYTGTILLSIATALIAAPIAEVFDLANIVMLFLLAVVFTGYRWGEGPAIFAATLNVAIFDFFFVPPRLTFAVSDAQYLITFLVMLSIGLIVGRLTAGLRYQALVATHREERARALYEMARELSSALTEEQISDIADRFIGTSFFSKIATLLPNEHEELQIDHLSQKKNEIELDHGIAQWAFNKGEPAGIGTNTLPGSPVLYLPLKAPVRHRGVIVIQPENSRLLMIPEQRQQLETFATLIAIALERVHFVTVARDVLLKMESERLRNSLLSALSHDLRTPLTALVGLSETLHMTGDNLTKTQIEIVNTIREQGMRMVQLVVNLLEMARFESGEVQLRKEWQSIDELIGSAIKARQIVLKQHPIKIELPKDTPLVSCDATLIERVLVNLLENAAKYTPANTPITIKVTASHDLLSVTVLDKGTGLPEGQEKTIFDKFVRGRKESDIPGVGLGLAICRAIVEAHGGTIKASNLPDHGASFEFTLPLSPVPSVAEVEVIKR